VDWEEVLEDLNNGEVLVDVRSGKGDFEQIPLPTTRRNVLDGD